MDPTTLHFAARALTFVWFGTAIADCYSTLLALRQPGTKEGNPAISFLMRVLGPKWVLARLAMGLASVYTFATGPDIIAAIALVPLNALLFWVIYHNLKLAKKI